MSESPIQWIDITEEEISEILQRAKGVLGAEDYRKLEAIVRTCIYAMDLVRKEGMTIQRLRKMLFGSKTEKLKKIFPEGGEKKKEEGASATGSGSENGAAEADGKEKAREKKKGHGRNGAAEYTGAEKITVRHPTLKPGDPCPDPGCRGKVYPYEPLVLVRIVSRGILQAKVITIEQLRCNLCLTVYKACPPEEFGTEKYDESVGSILAVLRYGSGFPMNRLEGLQESFGVPLPASTQWDILQRLAKTVEPAFQELIRQAAQGEVIHVDDTPVRILEVMKRMERKADDG